MENGFKRMKRDYDENSVFLVGRVSNFDNKYFDVSIDKDTFKVAITKEFNDAIQTAKQKFNNGNVFVVLWGMVTNGEKFDYIYPMSISFTSFTQPSRRVAYFSGEILNVYEFENRYRIRINSKKKLSTKIFATLYKSKGIDVTELQSKKALFSGYIYSNDGHIDFFVDEVYIPKTFGEQVLDSDYQAISSEQVLDNEIDSQILL